MTRPGRSAVKAASIHPFYGRSLVRCMIAVGVGMTYVDGARIIFSEADGQLLLASGAILAIGCLLIELDARRRPAPPTDDEQYAGPREASW